MASSSSSYWPSTWEYSVFTSFHGPDVRKTFLSHLRKQFNSNGITMFDDQGIERSQMIAPALTQAIRQSRISIVVLSKSYASSSWCLDELLEILKCKDNIGQIVMTVFYGVDPSDVRKQTGEFGVSFNETCALKTEEQRKKWSQALTYVGNIAGEYFLNWDNEANMIKKIARDVSHKLNATPSKDFEDMVGLETHLRVMMSLLDLDNEDEAMIVGISGPAGIGKTTISRALQNLLSDRFQLTCFMDLRGSDLSGLDDYGQQLQLQEQLLSKVLNEDGMRICHLGVLQQRLCNLKVLIILDDVNDVNQLKTLAKETTWFGPGSRIVVTTENKDLLQQHGISNAYHVGFPYNQEALKIFCKYAFEQSYPPHGFKELAARITYLCGNLPLGLSVMGSSLFGKKQDEWELVIERLETNPGREIDDVLRVSYERLHENDQMLFLHIAVFFNYKNCDVVEAMLDDNRNLNVKNWLKILVDKSLIEINHYGQIVMHKLLQQVGIQTIRRQEPWKRQILIDADEICDVLEDVKGNRAVSSISLDISNIDEVSISTAAFKRMPNLRFLRIYKSKDDGNYRMYIPEKMEFSRRLRLLDWEAYPSKSLPPTFHPEYLVGLYMRESQVEKLWEGIQPLKNLKYMDLVGSKNLKEIPDLSNATNLETLHLDNCESLVEIPSSFSHLQNLKKLWMRDCINLQVIPAHMNLASLEWVYMRGCTRLRNLPVLSTNIKDLSITFEDVPTSVRLCSLLSYVNLRCNGKLKGLTHLPKSVYFLDLSGSDIETIPDCIKGFSKLGRLDISHCKRLTSLPELPRSLTLLEAKNCESLETVVFSSSSPPLAELNFNNCFKLCQQAQKEIIRQSSWYIKTIFPGTEVPAEFENRAKGSSLFIVLDGNMSYTGFLFCLVLSGRKAITEPQAYSSVYWRITALYHHYPLEGLVYVGNLKDCRSEHLFIFQFRFRGFYRPEVKKEILIQFCCEFQIVECGAKLLKQGESIEWTFQESGLDQVSEDHIQFEHSEEDNTEYSCDPTNIDREKQTDCWSWLFLCFGLSDFCKKRWKLCFEKEDK